MIQNAATEVPSVNGKATSSKEQRSMDGSRADNTRPVMEGTEEFIKPIVKDGEIILEVECGQNKALLYLSKLCQGSKGPCIFYQGSWLTPNEFQFVSGRETAKDWKRSIRHHGKSLKLLLAKGILTVHPTVCECEGCRHSSTTPTRCRNGEKRSRVATSGADVKGKGTSSPVEHHVNGAFKPVQHVRPQIRVPCSGNDGHVIVPKQQEKICSPLRDVSAAAVCQGLRPMETPVMADKCEPITIATADKIQDKIAGLKAGSNPVCKNDSFKVKSPEKLCSSESNKHPGSEADAKKEGSSSQQTKHKHTSSCDKLKHKSSSKTHTSSSSSSSSSSTTTFHTCPTFSDSQKAAAAATTTAAAAAAAATTASEAKPAAASPLHHVAEVKFEHLKDSNPLPASAPDSKPQLKPASPSAHSPVKTNSDKHSTSCAASSGPNPPCSVAESSKDVQSKTSAVINSSESTDKQHAMGIKSSLQEQPKPPAGDKASAPPAQEALERVKSAVSHNTAEKCSIAGDNNNNNSSSSSSNNNNNNSSSNVAAVDVKSEHKVASDLINLTQAKVHKEEKPHRELKHTCSKAKDQSPKSCARTDTVAAIKTENADTKTKVPSRQNEMEAKIVKLEDCGKLSSHSKHRQTEKKHSPDKDMHVQSSSSSSASSSSSSIHHHHHKTTTTTSVTSTLSSSNTRSPEAASSRKHEESRASLSDKDKMAGPRIGSDVPPMMQQDAADAACSDYMRLLASGHAHPMLPPHMGAFDPLYALRFQEYPITPAALYPHPHSGLLPGDQMLYPSSTGMMPNVSSPCFPPSIQMYQPRLPYAIPMQLTEPLKPFGCLPYPNTAVYPCSLNGLKRKQQYDSEQSSDSPTKRLCSDYPSPQFQLDSLPQGYAFGSAAGSDGSRSSQSSLYGDDYGLRKFCDEKFMSGESTDAQVFSRWSELAAKTGYCRLCTCTNSRPNDIRFWSVEDVCRFLSRLDGCGVYAENFMEQRVDGRILPLLTTDHLIKNLGMKLGPAVLLTEAVAKKIQEAGKLLTCESCRGLLPGPAV